jgi:hypothetical protein
VLDLDGFIGLIGRAPLTAHVGAPLAYVGLGPGQEFIPYFLSLIGFVGAALLAVIQWPFFGLLRWFRRPNDPPRPAEVRETPHDNGSNPA